MRIYFIPLSCYFDHSLGEGKMIVAVDGPSGVGKGTLSRALAVHYNLAFLDTGLIYRRAALLTLDAGKNPQEESDVLSAIEHFSFDQMDDPCLRAEGVGQAASQLAVHLSVRQLLLERQRDFAHHYPPTHKGAVLDGRDIGTMVLPEADKKLYLTAHTEVRAERRFAELKDRGVETTFDQVLADVKVRDKRDRGRQHNPLRPADDAFILDTSYLSKKEVFEKATAYIDQ